MAVYRFVVFYLEVDKRWRWKLCSEDGHQIAFGTTKHDTPQETKAAIQMLRADIADADIEVEVVEPEQ